MLPTRQTNPCVAIEDNCCIEDVGELVRKMVRLFQLFERDQIKIHGFTTTQCYTLLELEKSGSITMNELSDRMNLSSSTMTRIMDNLVRDGYIERQKSSEDRRLVIVSLSDKGLSSAKTLNASVNHYYQRVIENMPTGKLDEVLQSANLLIQAFEKANPNCC